MIVRLPVESDPTDRVTPVDLNLSGVDKCCADRGSTCCDSRVEGTFVKFWSRSGGCYCMGLID